MAIVGVPPHVGNGFFGHMDTQDNAGVLCKGEAVRATADKEDLEAVSGLVALQACQYTSQDELSPTSSSTSGECIPATPARRQTEEGSELHTQIGHLTALMSNRDKLDSAELRLRCELAAREHSHGMSAPETLAAIDSLALLLSLLGRQTEAEPLCYRVLAAREATLGAAHPDTLGSATNLALLLTTQGRLIEAERLYRQVFELQLATVGPADPETIAAENSIVQLLQAQGKMDEAMAVRMRASFVPVA